LPSTLAGRFVESALPIKAAWALPVKLARPPSGEALPVKAAPAAALAPVPTKAMQVKVHPPKSL
jgi:hypothetical protein